MNRLNICISNDDYSIQYGCSAKSTQTTGGFSRYYKTTNTKRHVVSCSTVLSEVDYHYFRAFYLDWQDEPKVFICQLIIGGFDYYGNLKQDYLCSFVENSVGFDLSAQNFAVSFQLEVFINPLFALTSRPYAVESRESIFANFSINDTTVRDLVTNVSGGGDSVLANFNILNSVLSDSETIFNPSPFEISPVFNIVSAILSRDEPPSISSVEPIKPSFIIHNVRLSNGLIAYELDLNKIKPVFSINDAKFGDS